MLKIIRWMCFMVNKIIEVGYGKVNVVRIGENLPLAFFGASIGFSLC